MKFINYFIAGLIFISNFSGNVSGQFKIDAQYRPRFELRDGYQKLASKGETPAVFVSQRSRLILSYETENFKLKFTPQDVRIWGDEKIASIGGVHGDTASLDLFEAYAEIKLGAIGWISVGRQQIVYDNEWLLGSRNWNQNGNASDAIVFKFKPGSWNIHLAAAWNTKSEASSGNIYPTDRYKSLNFLWINSEIMENWNLSLLQIASGLTLTDSTNDLNFRYTSGLYSDYNNGNLSLNGNAYYQYGKNQKGMAVGAYLLAADVCYKAGIFTPGLGVSLHSGNSTTGALQKKDNLFDLMYSPRHKYFGFMDYFRTFSTNTKQASKSVSLRNIGHYFRLAETNSGTPDNKNLGYENDLVLKYKFSDWGVLEAGYLFILPTTALETLQNVPDSKFSQFCYLQLTLTPNLFKQSVNQ